MKTFKKPFVTTVLTSVALLGFASGAEQALAQSGAPGLVAGKSLGRVHLGFTPAQVHRALGKPDKTLRLRNGLLDDIYRAKKTRMRDGQAVRDKVEVLYRAGRVVQIEATSPAFETASGLSTSSPVSQLTAPGLNWRVLVYGYDHPESGWSNYYLVDQKKKGLTFEFEGWQDYLYDRGLPTTIIVHRAGSRPIPDVGGKLVTDSLDLSVVMAD